MEDVMKKVKSLKESGLLIKEIGETTKNEAKKQKGGFVLIILWTLADNNLGNTLETQVIRAGQIFNTASSVN